MFGKPSSRFDSIAEGKEAYEQNIVKPDFYALQKKIVVEDGVVKLQIKEIEPEVSALDHVGVKQVILKKNEKLFVKSDFKGYILSNFTDIATQSTFSDLCIIYKEDVDLSKKLTESFLGEIDYSQALQPGEFLDITFKRQVGVGRQYLLLDSWYRDWTLGKLYIEPGFASSIASPFTKFLGVTRKNVAASVIGAILGMFGGFSSQNSRGADNAILSASFATPVAHADAPYSQSGYGSGSGSCSGSGNRSLVVSYYNPQDKQFVSIDVIEPRYAQSSTAAITIPEEAFDGQGLTKLRVFATKHHKVSGIAIVADPTESDVGKTLKLTKAELKRTGDNCVDVLSQPFNKTYVETLPGDVLDLEFKGSQVTTEEVVYVLSVGGVYTVATKEEQERAGNWTTRLDPEARAFIRNVYRDSLNHHKG